MNNCREIQNTLHLYVSHELSKTESIAIEEHIQKCSACAEELALLESITIAASNLADEAFCEYTTINWNQQLPDILKQTEKKQTHWFLNPVFAQTAASFMIALLVTVLCIMQPQFRSETQSVNSDTLEKLELTLEQQEILVYFNQTETLLRDVMLSCSSESHEDSIQVNQHQLKALLDKNRYIQKSLEKSDFSNAKTVCRKINFVLLEISGLPQNGACSDIELLKEVMQSEGLILKLHLVKEEILFKHGLTEV